MNILLRYATPGLVLAALSASPAFAQESANTNLGVSANVTENCIVSTSPVAFGDVDVTTGAVHPGTGELDVTCTNGTGWSASADVGLGASATLQTRQMTNGSDLMSYNLYTNGGFTNLWGDGVGGATTLFSDTGTGSVQTKTIHGKIFGSQAGLPSGSYSDTVTVTVSY